MILDWTTKALLKEFWHSKALPILYACLWNIFFLHIKLQFTYQTFSYFFKLWNVAKILLPSLPSHLPLHCWAQGNQGDCNYDDQGITSCFMFKLFKCFLCWCHNFHSKSFQFIHLCLKSSSAFYMDAKVFIATAYVSKQITIPFLE